MADVFPVIISLIVIGALLVFVKIIDQKKFKGLVGSNKAVSVIIGLIAIVESVYLAISFNLLKDALEIIASLSAVLIFLAFVYLNKLQNAASGMSIALSTRVNVGDHIEIGNKKGVITQIGLTKTVVDLEDDNNKRLWVPNKKFDEEVVVLPNKKTIERFE